MRSIHRLLLCFMLLAPTVQAQKITYQLKDATDSLTLPYTKLTELNTGNTYVTDGGGRFIAGKAATGEALLFQLKKGNCKEVINGGSGSKEVNIIYTVCGTVGLQNVNVRGFTAKDVVRKALSNIDSMVNYESYGSNSFYRGYQVINGRYTNLVEAELYVLFKKQHAHELREAFSLSKYNIGKYYKNFEAYYTDISDLLNENALIHLNDGMLNKNFFTTNFNFSFDTTVNNANQYIISYTNNRYTTEDHGFYGGQRTHFMCEEGLDSGVIIINKKDMTIASFQRWSHSRYHDKDLYNIWVYEKDFHPDRFDPNKEYRYYAVFDTGMLQLDYVTINGKAYMSRILHMYQNTYEDQFFNKFYKTADYHEWRAISYDRYLDSATAHRAFFFNIRIPELDTAAYPRLTVNFPCSFVNRKELMARVER